MRLTLKSTDTDILKNDNKSKQEQQTSGDNSTDWSNYLGHDWVEPYWESVVRESKEICKRVSKMQVSSP